MYYYLSLSFICLAGKLNRTANRAVYSDLRLVQQVNHIILKREKNSLLVFSRSSESASKCFR